MKYSENSFTERFSRNEITNLKVLEKLVCQSSICPDDLVYDIGAGSGTISKVLLSRGARVTAIEKDPRLYRECKARLIYRGRFELYLDDFMNWDFPKDQRYKVFSNIPFSRTADIVNKLFFGAVQPDDCYLVIQKEAAEKYAGANGDTLFSLLLKPVFWVDVVYYFRPTDFHPVPSVDVVLLQVEKRHFRLLSDDHYGLYKDFIVFCREGNVQTVKRSLERLLTYSHIKQASRLLRIDLKSGPAQLNFAQYLGIFLSCLDQIIANKTVITGAERKLRRQQEQIQKTHKTKVNQRLY